MDTVTIAKGQIWREDDKRFVRFVCIICVPPAYSSSSTIGFRTCTENGHVIPRSKLSSARASRFNKAGGYKFVSNAPAVAE
jgi:hypothetical protein